MLSLLLLMRKTLKNIYIVWLPRWLCTSQSYQLSFKQTVSLFMSFFVPGFYRLSRYNEPRDILWRLHPLFLFQVQFLKEDSLSFIKQFSALACNICLYSFVCISIFYILCRQLRCINDFLDQSESEWDDDHDTDDNDIDTRQGEINQDSWVVCMMSRYITLSLTFTTVHFIINNLMFKSYQNIIINLFKTLKFFTFFIFRLS